MNRRSKLRLWKKCYLIREREHLRLKVHISPATLRVLSQVGHREGKSIDRPCCWSFLTFVLRSLQWPVCMRIAPPTDDISKQWPHSCRVHEITNSIKYLPFEILKGGGLGLGLIVLKELESDIVASFPVTWLKFNIEHSAISIWLFPHSTWISQASVAKYFISCQPRIFPRYAGLFSFGLLHYGSIFNSFPFDLVIIQYAVRTNSL